LIAGLKMTAKISTYWKCQLIGWTVFAFTTYVFNIIIYGDLIAFLYKAIILFCSGLGVSHLLKLTIRKTEILKRKFVFQIIYLAILTVIFSVVSTYMWMIGFVKTKFWDVHAFEKLQPNRSAYQVYFYYLFVVLLILSAWVLIYFLVHYVKGIRREEQLKAQYKLQIIELEAKALRAQMNPHFIFNCMNSIKSLIQKNEHDKAIDYLTTFSKLIRTVLQNSDKREITLFDELETCRFYMQLESMRFVNKITYRFDIQNALDLKSVMVPALIIQPFIENAIWHGIMPKEESGNITVTVDKTDHIIQCIIDDNGIGREMSKQNRFRGESSTHVSKGVHLTQARLELDNLLNERKASLEIIDKKDDYGMHNGTTVILSFNEVEE
jgi:sensor histidine kinase YesM